MDEEDDLVSYKDISELKRELEGLKGRKDISTKELYDAVGKLAQTISDMLEIFGAASEQMKLEDKEFEAEAKKHEAIISKLEKILDQNKTIAEGMVAVVEMVKQKIIPSEKMGDETAMKLPKEKDESLFKPRAESSFMKPVQQEWQPSPEPMMPRQPIRTMPQNTMPMTPQPTPMSLPDYGIEMPPLEPTPSPYLDMPDLDFPEEPLSSEQEPKKKGLFGMFKK